MNTKSLLTKKKQKKEIGEDASCWLLSKCFRRLRVCKTAAEEYVNQVRPFRVGHGLTESSGPGKTTSSPRVSAEGRKNLRRSRSLLLRSGLAPDATRWQPSPAHVFPARFGVFPGSRELLALEENSAGFPSVRSGLTAHGIPMHCL